MIIDGARAAGFVYPFDTIAKPSCRFSAWSTLGDDCKMQIPRITAADYTNYKNNTEYRRIYSVLWWATYTYGWDSGYGSHAGVDIATALGTPVRSIWDGTVVVAGSLSGWWNTVSVKHILSDGKAVYSNYAHLSKIGVSKGAAVKAGDFIGEVGSTGNSYGNHLHFQIDTTDQSHPYYYFTCGKGKTPDAIVDGWLCRDFLTSNTIDPIAFLENGTITTTTAIQAVQEKVRLAPKIEQKTIKTREQILEEEVQEFFKSHTVSVNLWVVDNNIEAWKTYTARVRVNAYGKPFTGNLPGEGLVLSYDSNGVRLYPNTIIAIENGERNFQITWVKPGKYGVSFKIGSRILLTTNVNVFRANDMKSPESATLLGGKSVILADEKLIGVLFRTKFNSKQIDIPYDGKYIIKSLTGKAKFCNVSNRKVRKCSPSELVEELEFWYTDTYRWVLLAKVIPLDYMPLSLVVTKKSTKKVMAKTTDDILVTNPNGIDRTYLYFSDVISALKKAIMKPQDGYVLQDRELLWRRAKEMIQNTLAHLFLRAWTDKVKQQDLVKRMHDFEILANSIDDYAKISRAEFASYLLGAAGSMSGSPALSDNKAWIDESGKYGQVITTLRMRYNFIWKDDFGPRYFQGDKIITIGEALYMIEQVLR